MQVEAIGSAAQRADLEAGECFFFDNRGQATFAISTREEEGKDKAAVVFSQEGNERSPWIATGGALPNTILRTRPLQIRTDPSSIMFGNSLPLGHVMVVGDAFYVAAAFQRGNTVTINLTSGFTEDLPPFTNIYVSFSRWSAGIVDGERWIPAFEFPINERPSNDGK